MEEGGKLMGKRAAGEGFGISMLKNSIAKGRGFEAQADALRKRHSTGVDSIGQEQGRLTRGANSSVQQKFKGGGGSFAKNLEQTVRRGKARQGIVDRGDASIRNQQLKDRLMLAKQSIGRRGTINESMANAGALRSSGDAAQRAAANQSSAAMTGMFGAIAGGAVRGFGGNLFNGSGGDISVDMDSGTAGADFQNMNFDGGGFDFDNIGQGTQGGVMFG